MDLIYPMVQSLGLKDGSLARFSHQFTSNLNLILEKVIGIIIFLSPSLYGLSADASFEELSPVTYGVVAALRGAIIASPFTPCLSATNDQRSFGALKVATVRKTLFYFCQNKLPRRSRGEFSNSFIHRIAFKLYLCPDVSPTTLTKIELN